MILPTKHLSESRSLLQIGAEILLLLEEKSTVSRLWAEYKAFRAKTEGQGIVTFDWFILALDLLFAIRTIRFNQGKIERVNRD